MIDIVMGGQYGSEGKGSVVSWLVKKNYYDLVIRTGGSQAGHTMVYNGETYKMRMIPCSWHSEAKMMLSKQAVVDAGVFFGELERIAAALGVQVGEIPVSIHPSATLLEPSDAVEERKRHLDKRIGSTLEGVGEARSRRILRSARKVSEIKELKDWMGDCNDIIFNPMSKILIESTQGWGLSLHGSHYPFATSADLNPHAILADAGIPFGLHKVRVIGVVRTFPIRVGGNSGFMEHEVEWDWLRMKYGQHIPDEFTTVTNKRRRIGMFEWKNVRQFCSECNPSVIFLTFCDYPCPGLAQLADSTYLTPQTLPNSIGRYLALLPKVKYLGVGIGHFLIFADRNIGNDDVNERGKRTESS